MADSARGNRGRTSRTFNRERVRQIAGGSKVILMSPCSHNQLVKAIRSGATAYFATEVVIEQVNQLTHAGDSIKPYGLTKREIEILHHGANGKTYAQIGKVLDICAQTAKNHMTVILRKLGANNKTHATALVLRYGLLSLSEVTPNESKK